MSENLCNLIPYWGGVLHSNDIANNVTTAEEGHVLDARQGKVLNDQILSQSASLNSLINKFASIEYLGNCKRIFRYGFNCDQPNSSTLTINPGGGYNCLTCLVFTRHSIVVMLIGVDTEGATGVEQNTVIGSTPFTAKCSNKVVTLTMGSWESFEMIFLQHSTNASASFTVTYS